jgi:nitrogen regulatory protein PII
VTEVKKVEAILRPSDLTLVREALQVAGALAVTVTEVHGSAGRQGVPEYYRGAEYVAALVPRVKLEAVVPDALVPGLVEMIEQVARTGRKGDGKLFVSETLEAVRVRTGERGDVAL